MKHKRTILFGIIVTIFLLLAFNVGQAYATTGCFSDTNGYWAETFICWLKDNGISSGYGDGTFKPNNNITRGEMAVMLQKTDILAVSQANNLISSGQTYILGGLDDWQPNGNSAATASILYYTNVIELHSTVAGLAGFQFTTSLPGSLYGHEMWLRGVQLCYNASGGASLSNVILRHYIRSGAILDSLYKSVTDSTVRTDITCRTYNIPDPIGSLWGNNHVVLFIQVNFANASSKLEIASTTFVIEPSAFSGSLKADEAEQQGPTIDNPQPAVGEAPGQ